MKRFLVGLGALVAGGLCWSALTGANAHAQGSGEPYKIGVMYDLTGPVAPPTVVIMQAARDYTRLINSKGGINGHPVEWVEAETGFRVADSVTAYEKFKEQKALAFVAWGTPAAAALADRAAADHLSMLTPGMGLAPHADGEKFPFSYPLSAGYWSQIGGALEFVRKQWKPATPGQKPKIAFLYLDNAGGREPLAMLEQFKKSGAFTMQEFAVPMPGVEMSAQVRDITRRFGADWVISHTFGKAAPVTFKELKRSGFPMDHVVALGTGCSELELGAAGWDAVEGMHGLHFVGAETDQAIHKEIAALYKKEGKDLPKEMTSQPTLYNWGFLVVGPMIEAIRLASNAYGKGALTAEQVRKGLENLNGLEAVGTALPPIKTSAKDHEGGGYVRIYQARGGKVVAETDWYQGFRSEVQAFLAAQSAPAKP